MDAQPPAAPPSGAGTPPPSRRRRWLRRLAWTAAAGAVLLVALILLTPWLADVVVRPQVVAAANERLAAPLSIGSLSLSWTGAFAVEDVRIGPLPGASADLASVERISGNLRLRPLLSGLIELDEDVVVESPRLAIPLDAAGRPDLAGLLRPRPATSPGGAAPQSADQPADDGPAVTLPPLSGGLRITDLRLVLLPAGGAPVAPRPLAIALRANGADQPLTLTLANDDGTLRIDGVLRPGPGGTLDPQASAELAFHLDPAVARGLQPLLAALPALRGLDADLGADGTLRVAPGLAATFDATLAIDARQVPLAVPGPDGAPRQARCAPGAIAVVVHATADPVGPFAGTCTVAAPGARVEVKAQGTWAGPDSDGRAEITATADLGELSRRWPGVVGAAPDALAGTLTADLVASARRAGAHGDGTLTVRIAGQGLAARGSDGRLVAVPGAPHLDAALAGDTRSGRFTLGRLSAEASGVSVRGSARALLTGGLPADPAAALAALAEGVADVDADIDLGQALAAARRVLPLLPAAWQGEGRLRATVKAQADAARPAGATVELRAERVRLAGLPGVPLIDLAPLATLTLAAGYDRAGDILALTRAELVTPAVDLDAKGSSVAGVGGGAPTARVALAITARPAALAAMLPGTMPAALAGQPIRLDLDGDVAAAGGRMRWRLEGPRLEAAAPGQPALRIAIHSGSGEAVGSAQWTRLRLDRPTLVLDVDGETVGIAAVRTDSDLVSGTHRVDQVVVRLPGLNAYVTGGADLPPGAPALARLTPTTVQVDGDLAALTAGVRGWAAAFGTALPVTAAGALRAGARFDGGLGQVRVDQALLAIDGFALRGQGLEQALRWPLRVEAVGELLMDWWSGLAAPLSVPRLRLAVPGVAVEVAELSVALGELLHGVDVLLAGGTHLGERPLAGSVRLSVRPAQALSLLPPARRPAGLVVADDAVASATLALSGSARSPQAAVAAKLPPLRVATAGAGGIAVAASTLDARASIDARAGTISIDRLALAVPELARVDGSAVATLARVPGGGLAGLRADLRGDADLARLVAIADGLGALPAGTVISGSTLAFTVTAGTDPQGIPLVVQMRAPGLAYRDATLALPRQDVALTLQGALLDQGATLRIASGSLAATTLQAAFSGNVRGLPGAPVADQVRVDLTYRAADLNPLLAALGAGQLIAAADAPPQRAQLMLSGPLAPRPGVELVTWLARIDSHQSGIGYGGYAHSGFTVVGPALPLRLSGGKLTLDHACTVNGGPTTLRVAADLPKQRAEVAATTTRLALTNDLAWLLKSVNPIFSTPPHGKISGSGHCQLAATWRGPLPPADPKAALATSLDATARVSADNVAVTGSPFLVGLVDALAEGRAGDLIEIAPTDVVVKGGIASYQRMAMRIGNLTVHFSGSTDLVRETVDLVMVAPFPSAVARSNAKVAKFLPTTITVPVKGPLADPQVDWKGAIAAALKSATEQAVKNGLLEQAGGLLEDLLRKRK